VSQPDRIPDMQHAIKQSVGIHEKRMNDLQAQCFQQGLICSRPHSECFNNEDQQKGRIAQWCQIHQVKSIRKAINYLVRNSECQACLPAAACTLL
jgi:hypothetical protein